MATTRKRSGTKSGSRKRPAKRTKTMTVRTMGFGAPAATRGFSFPFSSVERKFFDIAAANYNVNTTGSFTLLAAPVPGTDYTNRIGRKINLTSLFIRGFLYAEAANSAAGAVVDSDPQVARMILFVDLQPNGNPPGVTDLLTASTPIAHLNPNNRDRFIILRDKQYVLGPIKSDNTATQSLAWSGSPVAFSLKVFKKIAVQTIFNAGTAGTIADITSGALFMFWIGSTASGTTDAIAGLTTRVRFLDA